MSRASVGFGVAVFVATASLAAAQPSAATGELRAPTTVSLSGGLASGSSDTGAAVGGTLLRDLNDWVALEAQGAYLGRGVGADAFTLQGSVLVNLVPVTRRATPYLAAGGGLYRATFDLGDQRFLGAIGPQVPGGTQFCTAPGTGMGVGPGPGGVGSGTCPAGTTGFWGYGQMPRFYGNRLGPVAVPSSGVWESRSFTDPALSLGGGVRFHVTDQVMVRPDVRALVVFADGEQHTVMTFGLNVGYSF